MKKSASANAARKPTKPHSNPRTGKFTASTANVGAIAQSEPTGRKISNDHPIGIVESFVHSSIYPTPSHSFLIDALRQGLPVVELEELRKSLDLPMEKLVPILGISKATLHRRKSIGRLDLPESDRVVRYARLLGTAVEVMESIENARLWMTSPQIGLGGAIPLEYAETEVGAREVENLLGRIEHGVYS